MNVRLNHIYYNVKRRRPSQWNVPLAMGGQWGGLGLGRAGLGGGGRHGRNAAAGDTMESSARNWRNVIDNLPLDVIWPPDRGADSQTVSMADLTRA